MKKLLALVCACLALGLVAAGCGDDEDEGSGDGGEAQMTEATTVDTEGSAANAGVAKVSMKDIQFEPKTVTVPQGGEVEWTNDDSVGHDVTAADKSFRSGSPGGLSGGDTFKHEFTKAGRFKYECTVHPGMEGTVIVN